MVAANADLSVYISVRAPTLEKALEVWRKFYLQPPAKAYQGEDKWILGPMPDDDDTEGDNTK